MLKRLLEDERVSSAFTWAYRGCLLVLFAWGVDEYKSRGETLDHLELSVTSLNARFDQGYRFLEDEHLSFDERLRYLERERGP